MFLSVNGNPSAHGVACRRGYVLVISISGRAPGRYLIWKKLFRLDFDFLENMIFQKKFQFSPKYYILFTIWSFSNFLTSSI